MKNQKDGLLMTAALLVLLNGGNGPMVASAQEAGDAETEAIELSPFVVNEDKNVGYMATTTLAGTRVNAELRDVGASISVYTKEFLEDTGSTSLEDLLVYATGSEVDGINGNFSSAQNTGNFGTVDFGGVSLQAQSTTRIRALANADQTRSYFGTLIPLDSYNVDRVEVNRGANNILFGLGSPAGIINSTLATPLLKDRNRVRFQLDSYGSARGEFDVSRTTLEGKFNFRVIGLRDENRFQQEDAFENESRLYGALDVRPTKSTLIRFNFETGNMKGTPPLNAPVLDHFTNWWSAGKPVLPIGTDARDTVAAAGVREGTLDGTVLPTSRATAIFYFDGSTPSFVSPPLWQSSATDMHNANLDLADFDSYNPARQRSFAPVFTTMNDLARQIRQQGSSPASIEDSFAKSPQLQDSSVFNFFDDLLDGRNTKKWHDFHAYNVALQQQFLNKQAGIELTLDQQSFDAGTFDLLGSNWRNRSINIDLNEGLPDGTPNPNLGRAFISGFPSWSLDDAERTSVRVTAYGGIDFGARSEGLLKWLGKHTLTVLTEQNQTKRLTRSGPGAVIDASYAEAAGYRAVDTRYDSYLRMGVVHYLDAAIGNFLDANSPAGAGLKGVNDIMEFPQTMDVLYVDGAGAFQTDAFRVYNWKDDRDVVTTGANRQEVEIRSVALALQSRFFRESLVTTVGWRQDKYREWNANGASVPGVEDGFGSMNVGLLEIDKGRDLNVDTEGDTFSWGAVYHVPGRVLPDWLGLSLQYNVSENFNPSATGVKPIADVVGQQFDAPAGDTREYGFTIDLWNRKLVVRGTWYETNQSNNPDSTEATAYNYFFNRIPAEVYANNTLAAIQAAGFDKALPIEGVQTAWHWNWVTDPSSPDYVTLETVAIGAGDITDAKSKGFELEINWNPSASLRFFGNASKQEAVQTGIAQSGYDEVARLMALWRDPAILALEMNSSNVGNWAPPQLDSLDELRTQDGQASDELRKWRINLGGMYSFNGGTLLRGLGIGGSVRWQDRASIGYPITEVENQSGNLVAVRDINSPVYGPTDTKVDMWIRYQRSIMDRKVNCTLQLNVRNLLDEDDLIPARLNYAGLPNIVRFNEGRQISLTSTFDF